MANDFLIDPVTKDWAVVNGTTVNLCENIEDLTRQRIAIVLRTFLGEWFANKDFGLPYFQSIFGKNTKELTDVTIKSKIIGVDGVTQLLFYKSTIDTQQRKLIVQYKALVTSGEIIKEEGLDL